MKVLYVLENYYPNIGGVETLFKNLTERLAQKGHTIIIITTRLSGEWPREEQQGNVRIIRLDLKNRYLFTFFALPAILRHVHRCDLVHSTSYNAALPAFLGGVIAGKKVMITFHEVWGRLWFRLPFMGRVARIGHYLFEQLLLRLPFHRFIAVSRSTADALTRAGVPSRRVAVIHNGIDYSAFPETHAPPPPRPPFTYTYFGRIGMSKGLDLLLPAAAAFREEQPESRLQLIVPTTPAPLFRQLLKLISRHGLDGYVILKHELAFDELKYALLQSHGVVIPSYSEGFCFAAVESMAMGIPLISSGQGALNEVAGGKVVEMSAQSVEGLLDALRRAARGAWEELPLRRFPIDRTLEQYEEEYNRLIFPDS